MDKSVLVPQRGINFSTFSKFSFQDQVQVQSLVRINTVRR